MAPKRYKAEEIIGQLRTIEIELGKGLVVLDACRKLGITEQTHYRCKKENSVASLHHHPDLGICCRKPGNNLGMHQLNIVWSGVAFTCFQSGVPSPSHFFQDDPYEQADEYQARDHDDYNI